MTSMRVSGKTRNLCMSMFSQYQNFKISFQIFYIYFANIDVFEYM